MTVYMLYLLLAGLQYWLADRKGWLNTKKGKARYVMLCCGELVLLASLRGFAVGADTGRYLQALEYYSRLPKTEVLFADLVWPFDFEKGYFLFTKLCALINLPKPVFLLLVALIIYVPVFYTIFRYSKLPYISILAYFALGMFSYSLGIFRQMMALSIVLCGLKFLERKQLLWFAVLVTLAFSVHMTAIVMLALYVLAHIPVKKYVLWILPAELVFLLCGRPLISLAMKLLPQYSHYLGGRYDVQGGTYLMLILLNVLLFALLYLRYKGFTKSRLVISALTLAVLVQALGYSMAIFGRLTTYFSFFAIFAFSEIGYVLLHYPQVYGKAFGDALAANNWCLMRIKRVKINMKVLLWILFVLGLTAMILMDLHGNRYVSPYTFFFVK